MASKKTTPEWIPDTAPCPFDNDGFVILWINLLSMPKWKKKPLSAILMSCTRLKRFDIDFAAMLVESAIEGNYQGVVFPDSAQRYENWKQKNNGNGQRNFSNAGKEIKFDRP